MKAALQLGAISLDDSFAATSNQKMLDSCWSGLLWLESFQRTPNRRLDFQKKKTCAVKFKQSSRRTLSRWGEVSAFETGIFYNLCNIRLRNSYDSIGLRFVIQVPSDWRSAVMFEI